MEWRRNGAEPNEHAFFQQLNVVVGNAFMSSDIKNPVWLLILKEISEAVNRGYTGRNGQIVLNTTGPLMISRIVTNLEDGYDITILPSALVAPFTKNEICKYIWNLDDEIIKKKSEDAFCAHCASYTRELLYDDFVGELLDEICENIPELCLSISDRKQRLCLLMDTSDDRYTISLV